jgi:SAM-dependent methyltransferase
VDFLEVALDRARQRVGSNSAVNFGVVNIRFDPLPGEFDLICAIHVLEYIRNPLLVRKIRERIVSSLKPGGYLLLGCWTIDPNASYWWSRHLLRGSRRITEFFASHPRLTLVESVVHPETPTDSEFIDVLLQKTV